MLFHANYVFSLTIKKTFADKTTAADYHKSNLCDGCQSSVMIGVWKGWVARFGMNGKGFFYQFDPARAGW